MIFLVFSLLAAVAAGQLIYANSARFSSPAPVDAALFNSQCAKCHGRDGRARTTRGRQTHARDITNAEWQDDVTDERIFNSIKRGKGKMPSFKKFSDAQIDSLVSYVRRLRK
jgi:mono/diheme cytochrome c family protein